MPLLQLRQLTLRYSAAPLLDRIDFQVDAGERVCLLGRNGAGKTSLMRIITGEENAQRGRGHSLRRRAGDAPDPGDSRRHRRNRDGGAPFRACAPTGTRRNGRPTCAWRTSPPTCSCPRTRNFPRCRAGSSAASCWRAPWPASPTSCCSTSRRTISTSIPSSGWSVISWKRSSRSSSSRTTAPSCASSPRASWSSTAGSSPAGPAITIPTSSARPPTSRPRKSNGPRSTRSSRRRKRGCARA